MVVITGAGRGGLPTSGATIDLALPTGFGTPTIAKIVVAGTNADAAAQSTPTMSVGWMDGTRQRVYGFGVESAASGRENGWNFASRNGVVAIANQAGGNDGLFSFNSFGTDKVTLNVDTAPSKAYKYTLWAARGDISVHVNDLGSILNVGGRTLAVTAPGFTPDWIEFFGSRAYSTSPTWAAPGKFTCGWAVRLPTIVNVGATWCNIDNQLTTDVEAVVHSAYAAADIDATFGYQYQQFVTSFDANGFTMKSDDTNNATVGLGYAAIKASGLNFWCGIVDTPTSTGVTNFTAPGMDGQSLFMLPSEVTSIDTLVGTAAGTEASARNIGHGVAARFGATTTDGCASVREQDHKTSPYVARAVSDSKMAHLDDDGGTDTLVADFSSWLGRGFALNFTTVQGSACKWPATVIGNGKSYVPVPFRMRNFPRSF